MPWPQASSLVTVLTVQRQRQSRFSHIPIELCFPLLLFTTCSHINSWIVGGSEIEFVGSCGGIVVSALISRWSSLGSNPSRDIVLYSWAWHFILTAPLSTQVYKWVLVLNAGGNAAMDWHPIQWQVEILLVASCHRTWDKLRPDEPLS